MVLKEGKKERKKQTNKQKNTKKQKNKKKSNLHVVRSFSKNRTVTHIIIKLLYLNGNLGFIAVSTKAYQIYINTQFSVSSIFKVLVPFAPMSP